MLINTHEKISKNFTLGEAVWLPQWQIHAVPNEIIYRNILRMADVMQEIRDYFDRPINVHSWWRPQEYNKLIGGAKRSMHLLGSAVDFSIVGIPCNEVKLDLEKMLVELDIRMEDNGENADWIHVDNSDNFKHGRFFKP
jgi:hypothetical protein